MASGEVGVVADRSPEPPAGPRADPPGSAVSEAAGGAVAPAEGAPFGVTDRAAAVLARPPSPFSPRQLARLDEALTLASRETGVEFSVYVGALDEPTRQHAERLFTRLHPNAVLLAVSPGQRVLHIVTGDASARRLPNRACALAVLSMEAAFTVGDLVGGIVNGLRMLSDQVGRRSR